MFEQGGGRRHPGPCEVLRSDKGGEGAGRAQNVRGALHGRRVVERLSGKDVVGWSVFQGKRTSTV